MRWGNIFGVWLTVWGGFVIAQVNLSPCASTCIDAALANQADCETSDTACICSNEAINTAIQTCVQNNCTVVENLVAIRSQNIRCGTPVRDRSKVLLAISTVVGAFSLISVCIRMSVVINHGNFGLDDIACLAAFAASVPVTVVCCVTSVHGFGKETWASPIEDIFLTLKLIYASQVAYFPASGFTKLCFLFFFLKIFPGQRVQKLIRTLIGVTGVYIIALMTTMIFACRPISAIWTSWTKETKPEFCINQKAFYYAAAGCNIALDVAVVLLPIPELWRLKLSRRKKCYLVAIFSVGAVTVIISCIRLSALATYETESNPMYNNVLSGVWSVLEINVGIICICMPTFPRFLNQVAPRFFSTSRTGTGLPGEDAFPNTRRRSSNNPNYGRRRRNMRVSFFNTAIVKTIDMTVEAARASEDEVRLVVLQQNGQRATAASSAGGGEISVETKQSDHVFDGRLP